MYNEVLPGSYLCKLAKGVAYYTINKELYDKYHTEYNCQSSSKVYNAGRTMLPITHLLSGNVFNNYFAQIVLLNWEDMPLNYQQDACAANEAIRRKYHESIYGALNKDMSQDLKDKLFSLVDDTTGQLKHLVPKGTISIAHGLVAHELVEKKLHSTGHVAMEWPLGNPCTLVVPSVADTISQYRPEAIKQSINNNTNNSSMNLFNNMPGLNMDFGRLPAGKLAISMNGDVAFNKNGNYVTIQTDGTEKTRLEVGDFKLDVDFYKVPVQQEGLVEGDIILLDGDFLIVGKKANGETKFINPLTGATTNKLQRNNILGMYFYTKIVSLFDMVGGEAKGVGLGGLDPMTLMLLTQGTGNNIGGSTSGGMDLGMMLVMSQLGGAKGGDMSSMLPLMMLGGGKDMNSMLPFLLMNKGGGGLGNLFGAKKKIAPKPIARTAPRKKAPAKKTVAKG